MSLILILWIYIDNIFRYKFGRTKWVIISCMLSFDNPVSIDNILKSIVKL